MERTSVVLAFLILFIAMGVWAQEPNINRYVINVKLDTKAHTLGGSQIVTYYNDSETPLNAIYFLLIPNYAKEKNPYLDGTILDGLYSNGFDPAWMKINTVALPDGTTLNYELLEGPKVFQTYSLKDTLMRVDLPQELAPAANIEIKIGFETKFPAVLSPDEGYHKNIYTWRFGWNPIAISAKELIDGEYLSDQRAYYKWQLPAAFYDVTLTVPEDYEVAAGADHQELIKEENDLKTLRFTSDVPTRSLAISAGPAFKRYTLNAGIPVEVYYLAGHEPAARLLATYASDILSYFEKHFGEYGYKRLVIVEASVASLGLFGMAADALILIDGAAFSAKDLAVAGMSDRIIDYLLAHEIAHQWWGIGISADLNAENFLSEALAQYLSITYFESKYGEFGPNVFKFERSGLLESLVEHQLGFLNLREHLNELDYLQTFKDRFDEAIIKPQQNVQYANFSGVRIYSKGYLVLRALRGLLGEEIFHRVLKEAYQRFNHKLITVEDLRALAEEISNQNLKYFFEEWLYKDKTRDEEYAPFVDVGVSKVTTQEIEGDCEKECFQSEIHLFRRGEIEMPVEVIAVTEKGGEKKLSWSGQEERHVATIESDSPIKEVKVDPRSLVPDVNRLNNFYPRKFRIITTGENDLPLDAYLIRYNPISQTLEGGFLLDYRWFLGPGIGAFVMRTGRGSSLDFVIGLAGDDLFSDLVGQLGFNFTRFSHPQLGFLGKYWEAQDLFRVALARRLDFGVNTLKGRPINYLDLSYVHQEALRSHYATSVNLHINPREFMRLSIGGLLRSRLLPNVYLDWQVELGGGVRLPNLFKFFLSELHSFKGISGFPYPGDFKLLLKAELTLPLRRELNYNIANVIMLDRADQALFVTAGNTWQSLNQLDLSSLKAEVGFEVTLQGRTLGGLFPVALKWGFAYPLRGTPKPQGRQYIELQIPLL